MTRVRRRLHEHHSSWNDEDLTVGNVYMVEKTSPDGRVEKLRAELVSVKDRFVAFESAGIEQCNSAENDSLSNDISGGSPKEYDDGRWMKMYYVHYIQFDRRHDEFVTRDRIKELAAAGDVAHSHPPPVVDGEAANARDRTITRSRRRIYEEFGHWTVPELATVDAQTARLEKEHEERTKVKNIPAVLLGKYRINSWYYSPFPTFCNNCELNMCEYCLVYETSKDKFDNHRKECHSKQPPGDEIYRKENLSVYEVDGSNQTHYCQCLCLLSKLFMDHKTLYFDVNDFIFYVLCEVDDEGSHIVGYFSREVESNNNLACINVFPPFQDKGYGKLLIQLSYEISTREGYIGTPEKPLSDLGKVSYRSYWWWVLLNTLNNNKVESDQIFASELSLYSRIAVDDIVSTLSTMRMVRQLGGRDGEYVVRSARHLLQQCVGLKLGKPPKILLDSSALRWKPRESRQTAITRDVLRRNSNSPAYNRLPQPLHLNDVNDIDISVPDETLSSANSNSDLDKFYGDYE